MGTSNCCLVNLSPTTQSNIGFTTRDIGVFRRPMSRPTRPYPIRQAVILDRSTWTHFATGFLDICLTDMSNKPIGNVDRGI